MGSILIFAILYMLLSSRMNTTGGQFFLLIAVVQLVPPVTLIPRFILSLRELYACDLRGRRGSRIDAAFSSPSEFNHGRSTMIFANLGQDESGEWGDVDMRTEENLGCERRDSLR